MAIAVDSELVLDFLTAAQSILDVPYTLTLDGLAINVMFDDDLFEPISFRLINNSLDNPIITYAYLEPKNVLLTDYDPYLLSELDERYLIDMYYSGAFGLTTNEVDIYETLALPEITEKMKAVTTMDQLNLTMPLPIDSTDTMHVTSSTVDLELDGPLHLYDKYLLVEFDPDYLLDMYSISFIEGGL